MQPKHHLGCKGGPHRSPLTLCPALSLTPAPTTPLAKVGIHQLAGAARAAFQTALVNSPPAAERERLRGLLREMREVEEALLEGEACP